MSLSDDILNNAREYARLQAEVNSGLSGYLEGVEKLKKQLKEEFEGKTDLLNFWKNLQTGFLYFENKQQLPKVNIEKTGKYLFN